MYVQNEIYIIRDNSWWKWRFKEWWIGLSIEMCTDCMNFVKSLWISTVLWYHCKLWKMCFILEKLFKILEPQFNNITNLIWCCLVLFLLIWKSNNLQLVHINRFIQSCIYTEQSSDLRNIETCYLMQLYHAANK